MSDLERIEDAEARAVAGSSPNDTFKSYGLDPVDTAKWAFAAVDRSLALAEGDIDRSHLASIAAIGLATGIELGIDIGRAEARA